MLPRIKKRADFVYVSHNGIKCHLRYFIILCAKKKYCQTDALLRIGFTASKRVGNAVQRNRAKRRMRYLTDVFLNTLESDKKAFLGYDLVIIARPELVDAPTKELEKDFAFGLKDCLKRVCKIQHHAVSMLKRPCENKLAHDGIF